MLYSHSVEDDPFCTCDRVIEDAYHYFFICPNYNDQRLVLFNSVSQITEPRLSYLMWGNYELSVNDNDKSFNHVQTFIQERLDLIEYIYVVYTCKIYNHYKCIYVFMYTYVLHVIALPA